MSCRGNSHEARRRRYDNLRRGRLSARTGSSCSLSPQTALLDGHMNSMTLPNTPKRLSITYMNSRTHSNCLSFASIKNPHPFGCDCIVYPDCSTGSSRPSHIPNRKPQHPYAHRHDNKEEHSLQVESSERARSAPAPRLIPSATSSVARYPLHLEHVFVQAQTTDGPN
jgi:hypothetical protein